MRDTFSARGSASQTQPAAAARSVEQDRIARAAHEQATPRRACQWLRRHRANGMGLRALPEEFAELLAVIVGHAHLPRVLMHRLDHASVPLPARTHTSEQQQQHHWLTKYPPAREAQRSLAEKSRLQTKADGGSHLSCSQKVANLRPTFRCWQMGTSGGCRGGAAPPPATRNSDLSVENPGPAFDFFFFFAIFGFVFVRSKPSKEEQGTIPLRAPPPLPRPPPRRLRPPPAALPPCTAAPCHPRTTFRQNDFGTMAMMENGSVVLEPWALRCLPMPAPARHWATKPAPPGADSGRSRRRLRPVSAAVRAS